MVATSTRAAAQAGLEILGNGGNAVDAAIATAAASAVVEPCSNGLGGDLSAMVWHDQTLYGLNATGPAPAAMTGEALAGGIPEYGPKTVTVPGGVGGWGVLSERFGSLRLPEVLAPAIRYAEHGFEVTASTATGWASSHRGYTEFEDQPWMRSWTDEFTRVGKPPAAGTQWTSPAQAITLRTIADSGTDAFYRGSLGRAIADHVESHGGFLGFDDLAGYEAEWVDPIAVRFRGHDVWSLPPNGQGLVALEALKILEQLGPSDDDVEHNHRQIEAIKVAFADGYAAIGEPRTMRIAPVDLLNDKYIRSRVDGISDRSGLYGPSQTARGGTVYLATADDDGGYVSLIQSNFHRFGSGLVVPGTGIALHNRAKGFTLELDHPNEVAPGKRPFHTIMPGFLSKEAKAIGPFGVMGAGMQPQGHVQLVSNAIDRSMNPQQALDQPRWRWDDARNVSVEPGLSAELVSGLRSRGHVITQHGTAGAGYGRGQVIWRDHNTGALLGGTDSRVTGGIAAW